MQIHIMPLVQLIKYPLGTYSQKVLGIQKFKRIQVRVLVFKPSIYTYGVASKISAVFFL